MAAGHLVSYGYLPLLRDIYLGKLHYSVRKFIPDLYLVDSPSVLRCSLLVGDTVIVYQFPDENIAVLVVRPFAGVDVLVLLDGLYVLYGYVLALRDDLDSEEVAYTCTFLAFYQNGKLADEFIPQSIGFFVELLFRHVELGFLVSLGSSLVAFLGDFRVECRAYHRTAQGRGGLQGCILHIPCLVSEDGAQELLFRRRIALSLRSDLSDHNVPRLDMRSDPDDTVLIQVSGCILAYVRDIRGELLHSSLGIADFCQIFIHVYRGEDIPADHPFRKHDGVLVVVSFPRHERYLEVPSECQLAVLGGVAFCHYLSCLHLVSLAYCRLEENGRALVCPPVYRKLVDSHIRRVADEFLVFGTVVFHVDLVGIHIDNLSASFGDDLCPRVHTYPFFQSGSDDRGFRIEERHCLAHHVRSHQRPVGIIMLQERDQGGCD